MSRKKQKKRDKHRLAISSDSPKPAETTQKLVSGVSIKHFTGPLPPPEVLEKYNKIEPGFAARIMAMAESQSQHRQEMEKLVIGSRTRYEGRAQFFAAIIALVFGIGAIWLISIGKSLEGLGTIIAELVALTTVFILGRRRQEKELAAKKEALGSLG